MLRQAPACKARQGPKTEHRPPAFDRERLKYGRAARERRQPGQIPGPRRSPRAWAIRRAGRRARETRPRGRPGRAPERARTAATAVARRAAATARERVPRAAAERPRGALPKPARL